MFGKPVVKTQPRFVVFIALDGGTEGIAEECASREEMMKKYFRYQKLIKESEWLEVDDATVRVDIIRYIRFID